MRDERLSACRRERSKSAPSIYYWFLKQVEEVNGGPGSYKDADEDESSLQ